MRTPDAAAKLFLSSDKANAWGDSLPPSFRERVARRLYPEFAFLYHAKIPLFRLSPKVVQPLQRLSRLCGSVPVFRHICFDSAGPPAPVRICNAGNVPADSDLSLLNAGFCGMLRMKFLFLYSKLFIVMNGEGENEDNQRLCQPLGGKTAEQALLEGT
ncbi:MAG TPA: hypothetical protein VKO20_03385 [Desulfosalsimonadaceae bacterium]|nr:hypothetical protein [Desulfosalsimonadaceae bacterium]